MLAQVAVGVKTVRASVIRSSANDDTGMSGEGEMSSPGGGRTSLNYCPN